MSAAAPAAAPPSWRAELHQWLSSEGPAWIFVAKTLAAGLLALWIAFRLGFDSPRTALITVYIVAQPQTGVVLAKSFWRVVGTLAGCAATFVLVGLFAQQRELFLLALALWAGLCTAGAALYRNFRAYAFVLAGYTACLIGFPSALHPEQTFSIAVARASEILLGILCTGVVTDLVLPKPLGASLVSAVRGGYREFLVFVVSALRGRLDHDTMERSHDHFVANVIAFEAQRDAVYFENPEARVRSGRLRLFNAEFMASTTSVHMLHQLMQRLRHRRCRRALDRLGALYQELANTLVPDQDTMPATAAEAAPVAQRLHAFRQELPARVAQERKDLEQQVEAEELLDFDSAADLLQRVADDLYLYTESYASLAKPGTRASRPAPRYVAHADPIVAAISGVRGAAALLSLSVFWIATAWPNGFLAATLACVFCCLFAAAPSPVLAVKGLSIGFACGITAAFVCSFYVLPFLDGFGLLAAGLAPFLMIGLKLITKPRTAGIGTGYNLSFGSVVVLDNLARFDPTSLLNDGIASLAGAGVAGLAFALLVPADTRRLRLHMVRSLRRRALLACFGSLSGLRHRFENSTRDLLSQLLLTADRAGGEDRRLLGRALAVLEAGHAIIDLREAAAIGTLPVTSRAALNACVRAVAKLFKQPTTACRRHALDGVARAAERIGHALQDSGADGTERRGLQRGRAGLHLLRTLLLDDETYATLSSVESPPQPPTTGAAHAA